MADALEFQRRYIRQTMLPEIGEAGQQRLADSRVLVVGAGGLGSAVLSYLAAAGIGTLGVIDHDRVELSNLNRQILHETADIGRLKVESARDRIEEIAPDCHVEIFPYAIDSSNAETLIAKFDIVADGCDSFASRFAINAACVAQKKPLVSAAIAGWHGQLTSIDIARATPCYACFVHPEAPEANSCRESGIVGPLAGVMGSMQALEVLHMALGTPALLGKLLRFNGKNYTQRISDLQHDAACRVCATKPLPATHDRVVDGHRETTGY
jgi:molybdopterin/thiamine biosynthesis adenylyltransferase